MTALDALVIDRRTLLGAGPAACALSMLPTGAGFTAPLAAPAGVALGFWPGTASETPGWSIADGRLVARKPTAETPVDEAVLPAEAVLGGDPLFLLRGARLTVLGLLADPSHDPGRLPELTLEVDYDPAQGRRVYAWELRHRDGLVHQSSPLALEVSPRPSAGLSLAFRVGGRPGEQPEEQRTRLSLAPFTAGHGLRRGVYLALWSKTGRPADRRRLALRPEPAEGTDDTTTAWRLAWRGSAPAGEAPVALALAVGYADAA